MTTHSSLKLKQTILGLMLIALILHSGSAIAQSESPPHALSNICANISPDILFVGVQISLGQDSTQCVKVTNCGDSAEVFNAATGSGDYVVSPKVSPSILPDSSFTFCITYRPKIASDKQVFLFINIGASKIYYVPMLASTPCPHLTAAPIIFGQVMVRQKVVNSVNIVNSGTYDWKPGTELLFPNNGNFSILSPIFDTLTIPANTSIPIVIQYQPTFYGKDSALITFPNAGPCGNNLKIPLSGEGECALLISQGYYLPITGVGDTSQFTIPILNSGNLDWNPGTATISGIDSDSYRIISILPPVIAAGKQSLITVDFMPKHSGHYINQIIFSNAATCDNNAQFSLSGTAGCAILDHSTAPTQITTKGYPIRFSISISNSGLTWKSGIPVISGIGANAFKLISITPDSIAANGSMTITMEFNPPADSFYSATLTFPNSKPCQSTPLTINLRGQGTKDAVGRIESNGFWLNQNFPNPFTNQTSFNFTTPKECDVRITINDMFGKLMKTIITGRISEGKHDVHFDSGELLSGTYLLLFESGEIRLSREIIIIK